MNSRLLFAVTLMAVILFCSFTNFAQSQVSAGQVGLELTGNHLDSSSLKQNAERGDAKAQYQLGWSYMTGAGMAQDYQEAARWYRESAAQGYPDAEFGLGYLYEQGNGVGTELSQSTDLLRCRREARPFDGAKQSRRNVPERKRGSERTPA